MKSPFKFLFAQLIWIFQGCNPLGEPVNPEISKNHYYDRSKSDVKYSPAGNWFELGNTPMHVDVESFQALGNTLAKDKNNVYFEADRIEDITIDVKSFYSKKNVYMSNIGFDKNRAYVLETVYESGETHVKAKEILGADPKTFEQHDFNWGKDAEHHYYRYKAVPVDYESFRNLSAYYSSDSYKVYNHYNNYFKPIDADPETFKILEKSLYASDKNNLYFPSFQKTKKDMVKLLNIPLGKDEEIKLYNSHYIKVGNTIYYNAVELEGANLENFQLVSERYAKDAKNVYFEHQIIHGADSATFELTEDGFFRDKIGTYRNGILIADEQ